jgi:hypothetical protein
MWKYQLQQFADRTGLEIEVSHFPPGTSKWNKVEHRLFCYLSKNRQGKPLVDVQTAVDLIGSTRTNAGLEVICVRDDTEYQLAKRFLMMILTPFSLLEFIPLSLGTTRFYHTKIVILLFDSS